MNCFGFALLHSVIGSKFSRHFFNQSQVKPKPIVVLHIFPRFVSATCNYFEFDWFTGLSPSIFWLAKVITFVLVLQHSIDTHSNELNLTFKMSSHCNVQNCGLRHAPMRNVEFLRNVQLYSIITFFSGCSRRVWATRRIWIIRIGGKTPLFLAKSKIVPCLTAHFNYQNLLSNLAYHNTQNIKRDNHMCYN